MWWDSIEWANVTNKPTAIARIQDMTATYGSIDVAGGTSTWAGIRFPDAYQESTLMMHSLSDIQGVFRQEVNAWSWYWHNGVLTVGYVPWAHIINRPSTLSGYGITDAAPLNSPALTGTPTAPTPADADNSTRVATTAYVQTALSSGGGGLLATTAISPASTQNVGVFSTTLKPAQFPVNETTIASLSPVTVLSITGKGVLRFLSVGHSVANGTVRVNIIVNGVTYVVNDGHYSGPAGGLTGTPLVVPVIGSTATSGFGTNTYLVQPIPEQGIAFTTSLVVQASVYNGTGYIAWAYRLD